MPRSLVIKIVGDASSLNKSLRQSESRLQKTKQAAGFAGVALGGALVAGLAKSVKEAMEAEKSQARLTTAFKAAKVPIEKHREAIEKAGEAAINMGFDDEALTDSLGSLIIATGNYKKAQDLTTTAMDIARFKGVGLEESTKMLTTAMAGSQRAAKQLGISVAPVTTEYDKLKQEFGEHLSPAEKVRLAQAKINDKNATAAGVIDTVRQKVRGQAEAYKKTAAGEMEVFRAKIEELEEKLGKKLLPTLGKIVDKLIGLVDALSRLDGKMEKIGGITGPNVIDMFQDMTKKTRELDDWIGGKLAASFDKVADAAGRIVAAIKYLIDKIPDIPSLPKPPGWLDPRNIGDAMNRNFNPVTSQGPGSISGRLHDDLASARNMGLVLTSGYRPGAVTRHGTPSDHGTFPSKAIDVSGSSASMARFFSSLIGKRDVKQAFYDPLGSIFGGALSSYREGGHSDHVHVATYAKGGIFNKPTMGIIGERGPEAVIPLSRGRGRPMQVNLQLDSRTLASVLLDPLRGEVQQLRRAGGRF